MALLEEIVAYVAGRNVFAFPPGKRSVVDREGHLHRRLADLHEGQRLGSIRCAKRISYVDVLDTGNADDISYTRAVNIAPCKSVDLGGLLLFCCGSLTLLCENRTR